MPVLQRRQLPSQQHPWIRAALTRARKRPVFFFGVPFVGTLIAASFILSKLTQTRYDYNATKVQAVSHEEQLRLKHDRKKIDLREEYFRLASAADGPPGPPPSDLPASASAPAKAKKRRDLGIDWDGEQKRVERPPGMEEWGAVDPRERSPDAGVRLV